MYKHIFIIIFIFLGIEKVSSKILVADIMKIQIAKTDSAMRIMYGNELFEKCFSIDSNFTHISTYSLIDSVQNPVYSDPMELFNRQNFWYRNFDLFWKQEWNGDSISGFYIAYMFKFPGARGYADGYSFRLDANGNFNPDQKIVPLFTTCPVIKESIVDAMAKRYLRKPLENCGVGIYCDSVLLTNNNELVKLNPDHFYLVINYGTRKGGTKVGDRVVFHKRGALVDGCTGKVVHHWRERYAYRISWF